MQIKIKKTALLTGLEKASMTVSSKDNDPLLKTFNIEAQTEGDVNELRILSTDLQLGSIAKLKVVDITDSGAVCVDAKKILAVVRSAPDTDIEFKVENKQAVVKAANATWHLNVLDSDEYPEVPRFEPENAEEVQREQLLDAIRKVQYAAGLEETRPMLMMIAFNGDRVAASDGSRLQIATFKGLAGLQVPIFAVNNLVRLLSRSELDTVRVEIKPNHLLFQIGADTFATTRLFDEFPDVEALILSKAEKNDQELTVDKQALVDAITRVRIAADAEKRQLDMVVTSNGNGSDVPEAIELSAEDPNGEKATEIIHCTTSLPADRRIIVNHEFLMQALEMNPDKQVTMVLGEDAKQRRSPILMKGQGLKSVLLQLRPE